MTIPISVCLGQRGASGVPDFSRVENLRGIIETYKHTHSDRFGFETLRVGWHDSAAGARYWDNENHLGRPVEVYAPNSDDVWQGRLVELTVTIGGVQLAYSLKDMANRLIVRYSDATGGQDATSTFENALSIATYGTKDRLLSLSTTLSTAAANRAQTALNQLAFPRSKQPSEAGTGDDDEIAVELVFAGWYDTLDDVLTSSSSTTETATTTQATALLTDYNTVNDWFSTDYSNVQASGVSDTEYIDPQTTYKEKIETLLAQGDSNHDRLHWGLYENRALTVRTWAGATPDEITYYQDARSKKVFDVYRNEIEPWLVRPDAMAIIGDVETLDPADGAIEGGTRIYVARVTCSIGRNGVTVELTPDNTDNLEDVLSSPTGAGPAGTSARQAAVERKMTSAARPIFSGTNGRVDLGKSGTIRTGGGVIDTRHPSTGIGGDILTGGGSIDTTHPSTGIGGSISTGGGSIDTGGGSVSNTGGGAVDLGTGAGIGGVGSSGVSTSGGTTGALAKYTGASTIGSATAGVDYAAASHNHSASDITSGTIATARLGGGTASGSTFLRGDQTWAAVTSSAFSGVLAPSKGGTGVANADANTLDLLSDGGLDLNGLTLTIGTNSGTIRFDAASITTVFTTSLNFSGTSGRTLTLTGNLTIGSATTINGGGTLSLGTGSTNQVLGWLGSSWGPTTLAAADVGAAPSDAKYIVQTATSALSAEQSLGALATGLLKNTTTTGVLSIATASDLPDHASRHANGGADEISIDASQITSGTIATARLGSGTASSSTFLRGDQTWATPAGGVDGTGAAGRVALWSDTDTLTSDTGLTFNTSTNVLTVTGAVISSDDLVCSGLVQTGAGVSWDLGFATGITPAAMNVQTLITVTIGGSNYDIYAKPSGS